MARSHDMTSGSIWRSLLGFSIPIMISNLVQSTYNAVDMLFVGRFTGTESLAAVSVCGPIMNVMIITLSGMSAGVLVVISGLLGAGDIKQAQDAAHASVALYALMAAVMTVLRLLFVPQILRLVQTPAAAMPEAKRYLYTVFAGTVFTFGYNLIGALQRGLGNAAASMSCHFYGRSHEPDHVGLRLPEHRGRPAEAGAGGVVESNHPFGRSRSGDIAPGAWVCLRVFRLF